MASASSDLGVTKTGPDSVMAGANIAYTITVTNGGPDPADNAALNDPLPAGTTFVSLSSAAGWSCTTPTVGTNGTVNCTETSLAVTSGDVFTLIVHTDPATTPGTFFTNTATVSTATPDPNSENDASTASTLVKGPSADVAVTKSGSPGAVTPDSDITYTITVKNNGPDPAANVALNDPLPGNVNFVSLSSPSGWSCTTPGGGSNGTVNCTRSSLTVADGQQVFTLVGHVPPNATPDPNNPFITNQATGSTSTPDSNPENDSAAAVTLFQACLTNPIVVNSADSGSGSLRRAIQDACVGGTITFDMTQVVSPITLTSAELLINKDLTISGPGANLLTVKRSSAGGTPRLRIFNITSGTVMISGLVISNGFTADGGFGLNGGAGGGILISGGTLTITNSTLSGNSTGGGFNDHFGGGIFNDGGTVTITNSTLSGNSASGEGGGIFSQGGTVTITNSTLSGNSAIVGGGGIFNLSGTVMITNSAFSGNSTTAGGFANSGGGIANGGTLTIHNSTLSGNSASGAFANSGGGIENLGTLTITQSTLSGNFASVGAGNSGGGIDNNGTLTITNSTLSGNSASGGGTNTGGGISNVGGTLTITNSTFSGNSASGGSNNGGGGILIGGGTANARSTIIAQNTATTGPDISGTLTSQGHNLIGDTTGATITGDTTGNILNQDPKLGPLASNGGPTQTRALLPGSPAIDAGDDCVLDNTCSPALGFTLTTDQRGFARRTGAHVDIGAVEVNYSINATAGTPQSALINSVFATLLRATVTESGNVRGGIPVTFTPPASGASGTFSGSATVNTDGSGVATAPPFTANGTAGSYNVIASLGTGLPAATFALTNTPAATTTTVSSLVNPSNLNQSVTFTATVNSAAGTPTGTVQFKDGGANLGLPVIVNTSGVAMFTTSSLSAGAHTITAVYSGDTNFLGSTGTLSGAQVVNNRPLINLSQSTYSVNESDGFVTITVNRAGDLSVPVTVDYATSDDSGPSSGPCVNGTGLASSRCDFNSVFGTLRFAANDTQKTFIVPITLDSFTEGPEMFTVALSNLTGTGAAFATPSNGTVTINDSTPPAPNTNDDTTAFVRQQYHDFLNREADPAGLAFWKNNIDQCNDPANRAPGQTLAQCIDVMRINTSAAFFLSIEFQQSGNMVRSFYVAALNRPATNNMPAFVEFERDTQAVQRGVIVDPNNNAWQTVLNNNRDAFMKDFVTRSEFVGLYPTTDAPTQYVDKLYLHANVTPATSAERQAAIDEFAGAGTAADPGARGRALLRITQNAAFQQREMNRSFVQMEYVGYLRRNPNDPPDGNFTGYDFWVAKLNAFNGNLIQAEMVKAFLRSGEYRGRFGP